MLKQSERWIERLAFWVAIVGGIVLSAIAVMTCISIFGRAFLAFGLKPIRGDFELVEAGTAFVVCAFMPWAQLKRGHASVAILTDLFSSRTNKVIDLLADALLLAASALMTWRHIAGLEDKQAYGETTFIIQFPLWWAYAGCLFGLIAWIVVGVWLVIADIHALRDNDAVGEGAA